jgi:copper chaperone CopZ
MLQYVKSKVIVLATLALLLYFPASAQFSQARLQATGLTCALCSKAIHEALVQLPFVDSVRADIKSSAFDIRFKTDSVIALETIRLAVEEAGFFVGALSLTLERPLNDTERAGRSFSQATHTYRLLENWKEGNSLLVVGRGYMTEKEYKKMATRYADQLTGDQKLIFLLPKSQ